jgi:TatD DNase family protein
VASCTVLRKAETARAASISASISFSGIVTVRNADVLRAVASQIPADRLLIETDAPYLAPVPYRGKTNEPAYVRHVAEELAKLRDTSLEELASSTTRNFFALFQHANPTSPI